MKQINIGGMTFAELREKGKYYVDKTLLIKDILDSDDSGVYLFTRPRRFGKTTNMSMLDAFFNISYKGNNWFDELEISKYPEYGKYRNIYPVIYLDLGLTKADSFESFLFRFRECIADIYDDHSYLLDSPELNYRTKQIFDSLMDGTIGEEDLIMSVRRLSLSLKSYHGISPIILIDEYDRAVSDSFGSESHRPMMTFLSSFMYNSIKGNANRSLVYVTGVMQIAKESIFSGLNNIRINNVFSTSSDERFGFTECEVRDVLDYYGHLDLFDEAKEWYDGYRFGDVDVYNPFSIMNYLSSGFIPDLYWVNTATDVIVRRLLERLDFDNYEVLLSIFSGKTATVELSSSMTYSNVFATDKSLFSLMVMSGYLKAVPTSGGDYLVSIPNKEVMRLTDDIVKEMTPIEGDEYRRFNRAVLDGDSDTMTSILQSVLVDGSYYTLNDEADYQQILFTIMHTMIKKYDVSIERESGNGRVDIILKPLLEGMPAVIFELKKVNDESELDSSAEDAIRQIHNKRYYLGMKGTVILYGIAFWGKMPKSIMEKIIL